MTTGKGKDTAMTKVNYMALEDFQNLWTNRIKPAIPGIAGTADYATAATCESIIDELT